MPRSVACCASVLTPLKTTCTRYSGNSTSTTGCKPFPKLSSARVMAEANPTFSASTVTARQTKGPLASNMLSAVEAVLDPAVLTLSLWLISVSFEGELLPPYLILSVIVFSISFPGASHLRSSVKMLIFDVFYTWFWMALLLFFLGFATGYIGQFSDQVLITWLWAAPLSQIGVHLLF